MEIAGIIGNTISKRELEKSGYRFDIFEYEAKVENLLQAKSEQIFKVNGDIAVAVNEIDGTCFLFSILENPHIELIKIPVLVKSKSKVFGESINTHELIETLESPVFRHDNSPVALHTREFDDILTVVYKCSECSRIHLLGGEMDDEEVKSITDSAEKVYICKANDEDKFDYVTKKELIDILKSIPEILPISIQTCQDENPFRLTKVSKCPSSTCQAIHLDSYYDNETFGLN